MKKNILLSLIAAAVAGLAYFYFQQAGKENAKSDTKSKTQIQQPGRLVATLTLADGSTITLDSINNKFPREVGSTTVSTPRGGQYRLILSDGTKILLNAATSIRFPFDFAKKERKIELNGEAYFEVAGNHSMPFKVVANAVEILSLGTTFNVMAYDDEKEIRATLMKGAIKVTKNKSSKILQPGQQAVVAGSGVNVIAIDPEEATAWRRDEFEKGDLFYLMRQASKWYDIDVVYEGTVRNIQWEGGLLRSNSLDNLIKLLEISELNVSLDENGKRLILKGQ